MNIVTLWLKSDEKLSKKLQNCEKCAKVINSVQKWQKLEKVVKWANCNWTRFYKELLSQSFEILQMWPRHTQSPVFEIAIAWSFFRMTLTTYHKKDLVESLLG